MDKRVKILNQTSYWVENINAALYNAILDFMEKNNMKQKDLAEYLGISKGRISQILNDGEINFSLEKVIHIALKVGVYPNFTFEPKNEYLSKINSGQEGKGIVLDYNLQSITHPNDIDFPNNKNDGTKVISITPHLENNIAL